MPNPQQFLSTIIPKNVTSMDDDAMDDDAMAAAMDAAMDVFGDLIGDIQDFAENASSYRELAQACRQLVDEAADKANLPDEVWDFLHDRVLGRATGHIAYSSSCDLEGAGTKDFFACWSFMEDAAVW